MLLEIVPQEQAYVLRQRIHFKHYSHRTEKSYIHWIRLLSGFIIGDIQERRVNLKFNHF